VLHRAAAAVADGTGTAVGPVRAGS
jgi:hypothetical protein